MKENSTMVNLSLYTYFGKQCKLRLFKGHTCLI